MSALSEDGISKQRLESCLKQIEAQLEWGDSSHWRNSHFELLSDHIFEKTNVRLSPVTLKRVWGRVTYHSKPSTSTLDALTQYLGFENWIAYVQQLEKTNKEKEAQQLPPSSSVFKLGKTTTTLLLGGVFIFITLGLIVLIQSAAPQKNNYDTVKFGFEPVSEGLPNTVTFSYDVSQTDADSVFIQQSWDPRLRHQVNKNERFFATTYYYPGSFQAKLIVNDQIVVEKGLVIESNGWLGTIEKEPVPFYIPYDQILDSGKLVIQAADLLEKGYDFNEEIPFTNLHLVEDFGDINLDNFHLTTIFKNTLGQGQSICQQTNILLLCEDTPFIIPFSIKGCVGELGLNIPGKYMDGQEYDLSGFGVDFSDWIRLDVKVLNKAVDILVNEESVFQDSISGTYGKLVGIRYQFHGTGAVKHLEIKSEETAKFVSRF